MSLTKATYADQAAYGPPSIKASTVLPSGVCYLLGLKIEMLCCSAQVPLLELCAILRTLQSEEPLSKAWCF